MEWAKDHFGPMDLPNRKRITDQDKTLGPIFSSWLGESLFMRLSSLDGWFESDPVLLGSWARDELCPGSDIDLLFCGNESAIRQFVGKVQGLGLKIRHRIPEDMNDWTVGVEPFDVLATIQGKAVTERASLQLEPQKKLILAKGRPFLKSLIQSIENEQKARNKRFDSISNYLEPNLKYGGGGLRDIQQALSLMELLPERFENFDKEKKIFLKYKNFFLGLRQRLHLVGGGEILAASDQLDMANWLAYEHVSDFTREIQLGLEEVSFYSEVVLAKAKERNPKVKKSEALKSWKACARILVENPDILNQARVREVMKGGYKEKTSGAGLSPGAWLEKQFKIQLKESVFVAFFRSHLIDFWLPDLKKLRGLVQHDHYHRFTADAHLLQAVREIRRIYSKPQRLGMMAKFARRLSPKEWSILLWSTLFHDLGKGRGGDHSSKGAKLARRCMEAWGFSESLIREVEWMVLNHLILSTAAFRRNPLQSSTWKFLADRGAIGERLRRLAILTAVDIRATNPEAWTQWKERLLFQLVESSESPGAKSFQSWLAEINKSKLVVPESFAHGIESMLLESIPYKVLLEDAEALQKQEGDLPVRVIQNKKNEVWVRFHRRQDQSGLFSQFVQLLYASGCSILQSSIQTLPDLGVYDWFHVRTRKTLKVLKSQLVKMKVGGLPELEGVHFDRMELISQDADEVILSFRGRDQKGLLLLAAQSLFELGLEIRWAKVLTWGRQVDDIFAVKNTPDLKLALKSLEERVVTVSAFVPPDQLEADLLGEPNSVT